MPNQRHKDKKFVAAWLKKPLYSQVKRAAKASGIDVTAWVTSKLESAADDPNLIQKLADKDRLTVDSGVDSERLQI